MPWMTRHIVCPCDATIDSSKSNMGEDQEAHSVRSEVALSWSIIVCQNMHSRPSLPLLHGLYTVYHMAFMRGHCLQAMLEAEKVARSGKISKLPKSNQATTPRKAKAAKAAKAKQGKSVVNKTKDPTVGHPAKLCKSSIAHLRVCHIP